MRSEVKTAVFMGIAIAAIAGIASIWLQQLDAPAAPAGTPADKSGLRTAPGLVGIAEYINATEEELAALMEDKVVLYDIWTYSCINCVRTLPYITAWDAKYADDGLLIIGVHSPEFEFEKDPANVAKAVEKHGIVYPVVMDNDTRRGTHSRTGTGRASTSRTTRDTYATITSARARTQRPSASYKSSWRNGPPRSV